MTIALLFCVLLILWIVMVLSGWPAGKPFVSQIILLILLVLLGWETFGPLLKT